MNKINVSGLTDTELNRAMIWLYQSGDYISQDPDGMIYGVFSGKIYNYLTDYNLTMPLAFENELVVGFFSDCGYVNSEAIDTVQRKNPLRAISEALVMIKLEEMGL